MFRGEQAKHRTAQVTKRQVLMECSFGNDLIIATTFFDVPDDQRVTYRDLGTNPLDAICPERFSQIDHIAPLGIWMQFQQKVGAEQPSFLDHGKPRLPVHEASENTEATSGYIVTARRERRNFFCVGVKTVLGNEIFLCCHVGRACLQDGTRISESVKLIAKKNRFTTAAVDFSAYVGPHWQAKHVPATRAYTRQAVPE